MDSKGFKGGPSSSGFWEVRSDIRSPRLWNDGEFSYTSSNPGATTSSHKSTPSIWACWIGTIFGRAVKTSLEKDFWSTLSRRLSRKQLWKGFQRKKLRLQKTSKQFPPVNGGPPTTSTPHHATGMSLSPLFLLVARFRFMSKSDRKLHVIHGFWKQFNTDLVWISCLHLFSKKSHAMPQWMWNKLKFVRKKLHLY